MTSKRKRLFLVGLLTAGVVGVPTTAFATFSSAPSAPALPASSATMAAATTPFSFPACSGSSPGNRVTLFWTKSTSTFVTGYNILRAPASTPGSTTLLTATPLAATAQTYQDSTSVTRTAYTYTVRAIYRSWTANLLINATAASC